ncbi:MAG: single-stranded-DNA-specific exonuclease RecJ [Gammaproteobacteria bacterium]|jgi:single-stranded-DNA-specific exonuclease|nr:single-stranded-DNA-specific exonuclease RecJ [Gammaproteobacteria bacterium]NDA42924.1 single-stranded-DNA-specific exonuclease RecJ [Gammaproteobacteria bacterium]
MKLKIVRRSVEPEASAVFAGLNPVLARAYAARGIKDKTLLRIGLDRLLPVGTLDGIDAAVELLLAHRASGRRILVVGDFDADGATSSALIVRCLRAWGYADVDFLVPNRFEFGYGLTPEIVALAARQNPALLITVDNGISSLPGVAAARALGIDVLVTDHHLAGAELPAANVIVNPNVPGARFASRSLAGVGVAFYVMAALHRALADTSLPSPATWLDLVALGTVADIVPLDANNRILVAQGLARIRSGRCTAGLRALLEIGRKQLSQIIAADLGFIAGPRLNAAGRLDDMSLGIRCLLTDSMPEALMLAARLDELNKERRTIEAKMQEQAMAAVRFLEDPDALERRGGAASRHGLCLHDRDWHQGVVGIVAGRIKDRVRRPVIAFADAGEGQLRGSMRSVTGVHARDVLEAISTRRPGLLPKFGGHAMAAGLTLDATRLDEFAREFDAEVLRWQAGGSLADRLETDGELGSEDFSLATAEALREGGPWGQAFPEPTFDQVFRVHKARVLSDTHLKLWVEPEGSNRRFDAIAFNLLQGRPNLLGSDGAPALGERVHLVYRLDVNEWNGERRLQLLVDHLLE